MKNTTGWAIGWLTLIFGVCGELAPAAELTPAANATLSAVSSDVAIPKDRRAVAAVLKKVRAAIDRGDFDQADVLLMRTEKAKISYPRLVYFGDTPQKARRDLTKARSKAGPALPSTKSKPASEMTATNNAPRKKTGADPFLGRSKSTSPQDAKTITAGATRPPQKEAAQKEINSAVTLGARGPVSEEDRLASDAALLAARRALAQGDVTQAEQSLNKARQLNIPYALDEDSTAKVAAAATRYKDVMAARQNTEAWRRQYALALTEQAEALLRRKDFAEAERLATDAMQLGQDFGPYETNPRDVLHRIAVARASRPGQLAQSSPFQLSSGPVNTNVNGASGGSKARSLILMAAARDALNRSDLERADQLVQEAIALDVPDALYEAGEDRPWQLAGEIQQARISRAGVMPALTKGTVAKETAARQTSNPPLVQRALHNPAADLTSNVPASSDALPAQYGEKSDQFSAKDPSLRLFEEPAAEESTELVAPPGSPQELPTSQFDTKDPTLRLLEVPAFEEPSPELPADIVAPPALPQELPTPVADDNTNPDLQNPADMSPPAQVASPPAAAPGPVPTPETLFQNVADGQILLARQLAADFARAQAESRRIRQREPRRALQMLVQSRKNISDSGLNQIVRDQLLRRVDLGIGEMEKYIDDNRAQIALDEQNHAVLAEVDRRRNNKLKIQQDIARLVDEFNKLKDKQRYEEAQMIAKRLRKIAPEEAVVKQVWQTALFIRRDSMNRQVAEDKEQGFWGALYSAETSGVPFDDNDPYRHPNQTKWEQLTRVRSKSLQRRDQHMTEKELEIQRNLKTPVMLDFDNTPLAEVVETLQILSGVNIYLDPLGLSQEGVLSDTPVSIKVKGEIELKSALNLILAPLRLNYVIKDEVLKITSEDIRSGETFTLTYNVAELVIPIPNFAPGNQMGLQGAINAAHHVAYNAQGGLGFASAGPVVGAIGSRVHRTQDGNNPGGVTPASLLANTPGGAPQQGSPGSLFSGPGGLGGGVQADFDSIIELITATIEPDTWDEVGGPGSIREFENNLSLVISQTQEVHEKIADLLEQLRRLQDLQVTIEVRFIQVNDRFFERIGIDFDFNIEDGDFRTQATLANTDHISPSTTVGWDGATNTFTADLDIPFTQNSFAAAVPTFGGFDPAAAAGFGFAILSDIEAFFVIQAAQGDTRTNVLQAPKVTLFNGQTAFVTDATQRPFVISVIPVVGDFAAAQQPVIVVLNEGTSMSIQAVVSNDRRYVRMTVVPYFTQIGDVNTFTFEGTSTSTTGSSGTDDDDDGNNESTTNDSIETRSGTTVQLPTLSVVSVNTTVSVPDGGTVLLGGIKRLSEGRTESGVPMLSKIPYVNRLFRNVGTGRQTSSLMMMVTPRIIIQEEEEERLGISQ